MAEKARSLRDGMIWWLMIGMAVTGVRYGMLYLLPGIPQRTELWLTKNRYIANVFTPYRKWIDLPVEIAGVTIVVMMTVALFRKEGAGSGGSKTFLIGALGVIIGIVAGIFLIMGVFPYASAVIFVFHCGFICTMLIGMDVAAHDDLYCVFGIAAGISIDTVIAYGGVLAGMVALILVIASIAGMSGFLVGAALQYLAKRRDSA